MDRRVVVGSALAWLLVGSLGCAGLPLLPGQDPRARYLEEQAEEHVYQRPLAEVWPQATKLLVDQGYGWVDDSAPSGETDWKYRGNERVRYRVEATPVGEKGCRFEFRRQLERKQDKTAWLPGSLERDQRQEWKLLKAADPQKAAAIEKKADQRFD